MHVSIPLIALLLSLSTVGWTTLVWLVRRMERNQRVMVEDVPQLRAVTFGPPDSTGLARHEEGLIGRAEALERAVEDLRARVERNGRRIKRSQRVLLNVAGRVSAMHAPTPSASPVRPEDTGRFAALVLDMGQDGDDDDSDPPPERFDRK